MTNAREAIDLHIECLNEENEPVPIENVLIISRVQVNPVQS